MLEKVLIIYHRVDYDGLFGRAIAEKSIKSEFPMAEITTLGLNYRDPEISELVPEDIMENYSAVVIVDFCLPAELMMRLRQAGPDRVYWIDHHVTQIKESESVGFSDLPGLRTVGKAAAELAWEFFYPGLEVPRSVELVSAYDIWDKDRFDWETETLSFQYGLRSVVPIGGPWYWIPGEHEDRIEEVTEIGQTILGTLKNDWENWIKSSGIPVTVGPGGFSGICLIGGPHYGSSPFDSVKDEYDIYVTINPKTGSISMYTEPDRLPEFSCGEYMKEHYSGGGHKGAAGGKLRPGQLKEILDTGKV